MNREKDNSASTRPPRRWVWFVLGQGAALVVLAGLWLAWLHPRDRAKLQEVQKRGTGFQERLDECRSQESTALEEAMRNRLRYKKYRRRYKKLMRIVKRLTGPRGVEAMAALRALAVKGRAWGYVNERGKLVIPGRYVEAGPFSAGLAAVTVNGKQGYVNVEGKIVIPARFEEAGAFVALASAETARSLARVKVDGQYGVIDQLGRVVLKPSCKQVALHPSGLIQCYLKLKRRKRRVTKRRSHSVTAALYRADGALAVRGRMHRLQELADDRLAVRKGKRWGFVDTQGKWVILPTFKRVRAFKRGVARVRTGKGWGYVGRDGKLLGRGDWLAARDFSNGRAAVSAPEGWGFIDRTGRVVVPTRFEDVHAFGKGLAPVKKRGLWGFIDPRGRWVVKPRYKDAKPFADGLSVVDEAERFYHCVTTRGTIAGRPGPATPDARSPKPFTANSKWGYRDGTGQVVVAPRFGWAGRFFDGRARVRLDGKWGFVDPAGKVVIPATHTRAHAFSSGLAAVWVGGADTGSFALIDRDGKVVVPARYHWVGRFHGGFALATIQGADALIDRKGRVFSLAHGGIGCTLVTGARNIGFESASLYADAWERPAPAPQKKLRKDALGGGDVQAALRPQKKDGRYGYVDGKGQWVIPPIFERAGPFRQGRAAVLLGRAK